MPPLEPRPPTYPATDQFPPWLHGADKVLLKAISWALCTHVQATPAASVFRQAYGPPCRACAASSGQHMARSWWTFILSLLTLPEMEQADRILG